MPKIRRNPAYTLHAPSGQARCRIDGKDVYLGVYGSQTSREQYDDLIAEWLTRQDTSRFTLSIDDLCLLFLKHAESYYRHKDGTPTGETDALRLALRFMVKTHGRCRVREFGPLKLKEVRESMIAADLCRTNINRTIHRIKRVFAWGVENELIPVEIYQALRAVKSLKFGRTKARETKNSQCDMGRYFKPLRRKISIVMLVLGCCCLSGWIRSLSAWDTVISKGSDYDHLLRSGCGCIQFQCQSPANTDPQRGWYVQDPASSSFYDLWDAGPFQVVHWNYDLFGFTYRSSSSTPTETIRIDDVDHRFHEFTIGIPYWSIVIPLTLASAWLLLSDPKQSKPSTEPPG